MFKLFFFNSRRDHISSVLFEILVFFFVITPTNLIAHIWFCSLSVMSILYCRFTMSHEENIEFERFGLRNNVAQLCVLEVCRSVDLLQDA